MKCFIDTNVLISASLFPQGVPAQAYFKAVTFPNTVVVCDYSIDEMQQVYSKKFSSRLHSLESFLALLVRTATIITTPPEKDAIESEAFIFDIDDRPILRAAVKSDADILITGDKHFLKAGIDKPRIVTCREFLDMI